MCFNEIQLKKQIESFRCNTETDIDSKPNLKPQMNIGLTWIPPGFVCRFVPIYISISEFVSFLCEVNSEIRICYNK